MKHSENKGMLAGAMTAVTIALVPVLLVVAISTYTQSIESKRPASEEALDMSVPEIQAVVQRRMPTQSAFQTRAVALRISELCHIYEFKASFVLAVIQAESRFRPGVVSSAGAIGLMQLLPSTASYIAGLNDIDSFDGAEDLANPVMNVTLGIHYLGYLKKSHPSTSELLSAYNMGPAKYRRFASSGTPQVPSVLRYVSEIHDRQDGFLEQGRTLTRQIRLAAAELRI